MTILDWFSLFIFLVAWLFFEPLLSRLKPKGWLISRDMKIVRTMWMRTLVSRDFRMYDSNLMAHAVNSASFFASANLLLIGAIAGGMFTGEISESSIENLGVAVKGINEFHFKLTLGLICLARGFLNFIWSLRQMNYCAAAFGAIPPEIPDDHIDDVTRALSNILEPAMNSFSQGVRGYYFSLAAAAWIFGPFALFAATIGAVSLLTYRQMRSQAANGLDGLARYFIEKDPRAAQLKNESKPDKKKD